MEQRIVLLNRLVSRSVTRAPQEHAPVVHNAEDLLGVIDKRRKDGWAIEYIGMADSDDDDETRIAKGDTYSFVRIRHMRWSQDHDYMYVTLLFETGDAQKTAFPVVNRKTFAGREITGEREEIGATTAHVVVRMPIEGRRDDFTYRCGIEQAAGLHRSRIEFFLCRQLRRWSDPTGLTFSVVITKPKKKPVTKNYLYTPRLELFADVGTSLKQIGPDGRVLSTMVFTKRRERRHIGQAAAVLHEDLVADVEWRVSARQGPQDGTKLRQWTAAVRAYFENQGYESRFYYRHVNGAIVSGGVHEAVAGATDLLVCPKQFISPAPDGKVWRATIDGKTVDEIKSLLNEESLWERAK